MYILTKERVVLILFFFIVCVFSFLQGINQSDECWFFQVVCRMNRGEILYRDIFFGATPLSAYLAKWVVSLVGEELWALKSLMILSFTATFWIVREIGRVLAIQKGLLFFLPLAMLAFSERNMFYSSSLYNPLANLFFLISFYLVLKRFSGWAGLIAGFCFCAKHTHGIWAVAAVITASIYQREKIAVPFLTFLSVVAACMGWLYFSNTLDGFLDYGLLNKISYLNLAGVNYFQRINFKSYLAPLFLLPAASCISLLVGFRRGLRRESVLVGIFLAAAYLNVYPRGEAAHLSLTLPLGLISLLLGCEKMEGMAILRFGRIACSGLSLLLIALLAQPLIKEPLVFCDWPHFKGMVIHREKKERIDQFFSTFKEKQIEKPVVFLDSEAGFYYLVLGMKNPTPYDYPAATSMGLHGVEEVASLWSNGQIQLFVRENEIEKKNIGKAISWIQNQLAGHGFMNGDED